MTNEDLKKLYDRAAGTETANETEVGPVVHVRVQGRSRDIALYLLDLTTSSSDDAIRNAVATFMELPPATLRGTVIERHENGNLTVRPEAVFG